VTRSREELKRELMAKAESVIDELLAKRKDPREATLSDIERAVLVAGQRLEQELTASLVKESAAQVEEEWPRCPECGGRMKAKGKRTKRLVTEKGQVRLERAYYYCAVCRRGIFPPG
jgi:uncharacterized protein with PIN domain